MQSNQISVIIPTLAERQRFSSIRRCIASIRLAGDNLSRIIVVANGSRSDPLVMQWLADQADITLIEEPAPSAPNAVRIGRDALDTPFFSTIDDDDEYLPGSINLKLKVLLENPDADLVVTNGFSSEKNRLYTNLAKVPSDPLKALFDENWLASCNALFRSDSVPSEFFQDFHPYAEWTWLAFKLALSGKKVATLDEPCFRLNYTPQSLSQSASYKDAYPPLFERMLNCNPPGNIRRLIQRRISAVLHDRSEAHLESGNYLKALQAHLQSLLLPGGMRYVSYTRRLIPGWPRA